MINRREFIRHIGIGLCAGAAVPFIPSLLPEAELPFVKASGPIIDRAVKSTHIWESTYPLWKGELISANSATLSFEHVLNAYKKCVIGVKWELF